MMCSVLFTVIICSLPVAFGGVWERAVLDHLFNNGTYNPNERPVENEKQPLPVSFGISLQQIIDVDERSESIATLLWLQLKWNAYNLRWNKEDFNNVTEIRMPKKLVWVPDVFMYNSASDDFDETYPTKVVISHDGSCLWVPPGMFKSTCSMDITYFPFDDQHCELKFGSWSHNGLFINLTQDNPEGGDLSSFTRNGEWMLLGMPVKRNVITYDCCPEVYYDLTFTIHIRRRTLFYGYNIMIPCLLISSLTLLLFVLPPDTGEKVSLGITILLSLMVFLLQIGEMMPPTSDAVPLIGIYFLCVMVMCAISIVFTVGVLNMHYRTLDVDNMPSWLRTAVCDWLARLLRMTRPGAKTPGNLTNHAIKNMESSGEATTSLIEDAPAMSGHKASEHNENGSLPDFASSAGTNLSKRDVRCILQELRKITSKFQQEEEEEDARNEWKFAAMVMDRFFFFVCLIITVGSTIAIFGSAPYLSP